MAEFKKGDVVILKSGGPKMTVEDFGDFSPAGSINGVRCVWFDQTTKKDGVFDVETLKIFEQGKL